MRLLITRPRLRAPVLLWRQPGLLLALAAAAFVAVLPAASAPLFLSSGAHAAPHRVRNPGPLRRRDQTRRNRPAAIALPTTPAPRG